MRSERPYLIYGSSGQARVAATAILPHANVLGFVVADEVHESGVEICGRPVHPLSRIRSIIAPSECVVFVAASYREMNGMRRRRSEEMWELGYQPGTFVSPHAWVADGVVIGDNSLVLDGVSIHAGTIIGQGCFVSSGSILGHDCEIGNYNWIGSASVFAGYVKTGTQCFFGLRATVTQHVCLGDRVYVGATALVGKNLATGAVQIAAQRTESVDMDSMRYCALVTP